MVEVAPIMVVTVVTAVVGVVAEAVAMETRVEATVAAAAMITTTTMVVAVEEEEATLEVVSYFVNCFPFVVFCHMMFILNGKCKERFTCKDLCSS